MHEHDTQYTFITELANKVSAVRIVQRTETVLFAVSPNDATFKTAG
jgi:hypothetical protein